MAHSCFLGLPLEVRTEIYSYVLPSKYEYNPNPTPCPSPARPYHSPTSPPFSPADEIPVYTPTYTPTNQVWNPSTSPPRTGLESPESDTVIPIEDLVLPGPAHGSTSSAPVFPLVDDPNPTPHSPVHSPVHDTGTPPFEDGDLSPIYSPTTPTKLLMPNPTTNFPFYSILHVNKQIYSEVKEFLYRRHFLKIDIDLNNWFSNNDTKISTRVVYQSPWEDVMYRNVVDLAADTREKYYVAGERGLADDYDSAVGEDEGYIKPENTTSITLGPRPEYQQYIRHIRIVILDNRWSNRNNEGLSIAKLRASTRSDSRLLLLPFLLRLREILSDHATVDITVFSPEAHLWGYTLIEDLEKEAARESHEQTIETAFLLTRGPWKSTMELVQSHLEYTFPGIEQEVASKCEAYPEYQETTLQQAFKELNVDIPGGAWWGYKRGKRMLFRPDRYSAFPNFPPWEASPSYHSPYKNRRHFNPHCACVPRSPY
ncbi:hypothetical protein TWF481_008876 [Arthrobotrys musiformis]|uniref:FCP1 homology domain-containing protein n=1 Tax=Arthrobotrys musiformis TaxID=47236 RepID=A0AAV9W8L3_9PEZI